MFSHRNSNNKTPQHGMSVPTSAGIIKLITLFGYVST